MRTASLITAWVVATSLAAAAQAPEPPVTDTRLTVHTLVREDVFAGFQQNDVARLARAEKNLELLTASRPAERASVLAWQGAAALTRAVHAHERTQPGPFAAHYRQALDAFAEAMRLGPDTVGVFAVVGGANVSVADRLPPPQRAAGWEQAYAAYQRLWQMQGETVTMLPLHHKGELLAGLAQTAQRTGRVDELAAHLARILTLMPDTPYAARAQEWKDTPSTQAGSTIACRTCHAPGMLVARTTALSKQ
jgi:hypothetical protein